jgi:hypothetical protein
MSFMQHPISSSVKRESPLFLTHTAMVAAVIMLALIPVQIAVFTAFPPPDSAEGFLTLFQDNWLLGFLSMDFLYLINTVILVILYLSLSVRLVSEAPQKSALAFVIGLVGIACYFPSNPVFEMFALSKEFALAQPSERPQLLVVGNALMAGYTGTAFIVYYILNGISLVLYAWAMLESTVFTKTIGVYGLVSGILMLVPSTFGMVGMVFSLLSLIPWVVFLVLLVKEYSKIPPLS